MKTRKITHCMHFSSNLASSSVYVILAKVYWFGWNFKVSNATLYSPTCIKVHSQITKLWFLNIILKRVLKTGDGLIDLHVNVFTLLKSQYPCLKHVFSEIKKNVKNTGRITVYVCHVYWALQVKCPVTHIKHIDGTAFLRYYTTSAFVCNFLTGCIIIQDCFAFVDTLHPDMKHIKLYIKS